MKRQLHNIAMLETTNECNFSCSSCVAWCKKGKDYITLETVHKACKLFKDFGFMQVQLYWRGEPCLHPELPEIAKIVQGYGLITIVCSNGHAPLNADKEWMTELLKYTNHYATCLDGWNEENIGYYRKGANWKQFFDNLELIKEAKCDKILMTLMFKWNEGKEDYIKEIAENYGMRQTLIAPDILGKCILSQAEADKWNCETHSAYVKFETKYLPEVVEWRGKQIKPKKLGNEVYVYNDLKVCKEGNLVVAATGEIAACPQMPNMKTLLGTANDTKETILSNYMKLESEMYHRQLYDCKNFCLCLRK